MLDFSAVRPVFEALDDPRAANVRHKLSDLLIMTWCALLAGCEDFLWIHEFCLERRKVFKKHLGVSAIPSHDTFSRVLSLIKPEVFEAAFRQACSLDFDAAQLGVVAIDGKAQTRSGLHAVSAWSREQGVCLGTEHAPHAKGSELPTMVGLIQSLALKGTILTSDAMGCNESFCSAAVEAGADYVIALKGNQGNALDSAKVWGDSIQGPADHVQPVCKERSGIVQRECFVRSVKEVPFMEFSGIKSMALLRKTITDASGVSKIEARYYISSLSDAKTVSEAIRAHWSVENNLHWTLDVMFKEDQSLARDKNLQKNMGVMRKLAINYMKTAQVGKRNTFRRKLMMNESALSQLLGLMKL
jgi:predicted transposase YbfD/YdcC